MSIWIDTAGTVVEDHQPYVDADGTTYTAQFPKAEIADLTQVIEVERPNTDPAAYTVDGQARGGVFISLGEDGREWTVQTVKGKPTQVWITEARPDITLDEAKAIKKVALTGSYATACASPVSYTTIGKVAKAYQADAGSVAILQQTLAGLSGIQATPAGFWWLSDDNTQVPFAYADLQGLAAAMLSQGWTAFQRLQTLKAEVAAASTVTAVQAVEW